MTWLPVVGWEGFYEVSDRGEVRSVERRVTCSHGFDRVYKAQYLKVRGNPHRMNYQEVTLSRPGEIKHGKVHRMVLEAFVGPCPDGMECRHLNNDPTDNRLENLAWGTKAENGADRAENGLKKGDRHHDAKLTAFQVFMLRERPKYRGLISDIAAEFGISRVHASRIRGGTYWGWL